MKANQEKTTMFALGPLLLFELVLLLGPVVAFTPKLMWHDQQRIEQIVLLCLLTACGLFIWRTELEDMGSRMPRWIKLSWAFGLGLGLLSATRAEFPRYAGLEWASFFLLAWCAVLLAGQSRREGAGFDRWATRVVVLAAFFISAKAMVNYGAALYWDRLDAKGLFTQSFSNPRFFGQAASMLLPVLAYPLLNGRNSRFKRGAVFSLLALLWMLAIASATRGTWLAMLVAAGVLALVSWQASQSWLKVQIAACLTGLGLFAVFFLWLPEIAQHNEVVVENRFQDITTLSRREDIWMIAWQKIQEHPWLGVGPMHLAAIKNAVACHPHSALLQVGAEWGLPATFALLAPLAYAMLALLSRIRKQQSESNIPLMVCLSASLLAAATQSMVDGVIVMPYSQTLLVFVCGWALGLYFRSSEPGGSPRAAMAIPYINYLLPALALGLMFLGIYPEVFNRIEITRQLLDGGVTYFNPRYWAHGWIP